MDLRLQPLARSKVASLGEPGAQWLARLPATLDTLAARWDLAWDRPLPGGSAAYVRAARTAHGEERVVKVAMPDPTQGPHEAEVLRAAQGRGYAVLHDHAPEHAALLLERLQARPPRSPELTLDHLVDTLAEAWRVRLDLPRVDRAAELMDVVRRVDDRLGACDPRLRRQAEEYAAQLADPGPDGDVVCHGDAHPTNLLAREGGGHAFVDPDGVRADPAYDLGVTLREWNAHISTGGRRWLEERVDRVAERSGVDRGRIWRWAFLARVSTGLYVLDFGAHQVGRGFLDAALRLRDPNPRPT